MSQEFRTIQSNFSAGLVSPMQEGSIGSGAYQSGVGIAENVIFGPGYGFAKRPGTKFETEAMNGDMMPNLFSFEYRNTTFFLEFFTASDGANKVRTINLPGSKAQPAFPGSPKASDIRQNGGITSVMPFGAEIYVVGRGMPCRIPLSSTGDIGECREIQLVNPVMASSNPKEGDIRTFTLNPTGGTIVSQMFYGGRWFLAVNKSGEQSKIYYSRAYDSETGQYRFNDFTYRQEIYRRGEDGTYYWEPMELADLAGEFSDASMGRNSISWMMDNGGIFVGTTSGIYSNGGTEAITSTADSPLVLRRVMDTKAVASMERETYCELGSYMFFSDISNNIRCITYTDNRKAYSAPVISGPVARILQSGVAQMVAVDGPSPSLFVLTMNNDLLCCQFDSGQVLAWSRITFQEGAVPFRIVPVNYPCIGRTPGLGILMIRGEMVTIESLAMPSLSNVWSFPSVDCFHAGAIHPLRQVIDLTMESFHTDEEGRSLLEARVIQKNTFPPSQEGVWSYLGVPFAMVIGTLRSELPANGTSQGAKRTTSGVTLRLYNTLGGEIGLRPQIDETVIPASAIDLVDHMDKMLFRLYGKDMYGNPQHLFTGDKSTQFSTPVLDDDRMVIISRDPFPFCVAAVIVKHSVKEG